MQNKSTYIHILSFLEILKRQRCRMLLFCFMGSIIGIALAFCQPKTYTSSVKLMPETDQKKNNIATTIGELVGWKDYSEYEDAIYPEIYSEILKSRKFQISLWNMPVTTKNGETLDYAEYLQTCCWAPFWYLPKVWIKSFLHSFDTTDGAAHTIDYGKLTEDEAELCDAVIGGLSCSVDKVSGEITLSATAQDAVVAAHLADSLVVRLQQEVDNYKTEKEKTNLLFLEKIYKEAKKEYDDAQKNYASFVDANMDVENKQLLTKQEKLENNLQLAYNVSTAIYSQLYTTRSGINHNKDIYTQVQNATVVHKANNPSKAITAIKYFFYFGFIYILIVLFKHRNTLISKE